MQRGAEIPAPLTETDYVTGEQEPRPLTSFDQYHHLYPAVLLGASIGLTVSDRF